MRAAASSLALLLAVSACNDSPQQAEANNSAVTEIEALPPDESVETPADELADGATEPAENAAEPANTGNAAY
jgi:hypothetical protein